MMTSCINCGQYPATHDAWCDNCGPRPPTPELGSAWIECKTRMPTAADAPNRTGRVWWMVCDGFVCEPSTERWDWKCLPSCTAVAWMPIPPHPKWYPLENTAQP